MALLLLSFLLLALSSVYAQSPTAAVYALSNNASGNELYIYTVNLNDGSLTYAYALSTGGKGAGIPHSQSSLTRVGNYLFAVNAGSNSLSLFYINGTNATNVTFIQSANVQGSMPTSVAVTPASTGANYACVGTTSLNLTISCFTFNQSGLTYVPSWTRYLGIYANDSSYPLSEVAFSPSASYLVAQIKGHFSGSIIYPIGVNGNLSAIPVITPSGISTSPLGPQSYGFVFTGTNSILTTDAAVGLISYSFNGLGAISSSNNHSLTPAGATGYCWIVASPLTKDYYAISAQNITEVSVGSDGTISQKATQSLPYNLSEGTIISTTSGVDYLYVLSQYQGVTQFKISGPGQFAYTRAIPYPNNGTNNSVSGIASALTTASSPVIPSSASTLVASLSVLFAAILATLMAL
jgi:6-phosphogluconolactonase